MYKRIIYRSVLILTLVLSCSCNKYLTLYPQDGTTRQEFWQNKEQLQSAVIGIYSSLLAGTPATIASGKPSAAPELVESLFLWGELRADNVAQSVSTGTPVDMYNIMDENILSTNSYVKWSSVYTTINYCNTVLRYGPDVANSDPTLTPANLNAYMAEALAIRALMYFYLVRTFGDVPLKLNPTATDNDLEFLAKSPQADVLKQILSDLTTAEANAKFTYGVTASDKGRVTKYMINALQADIYLWQYDYANCITACDKIIKSNQFGLVSGNSLFNNVYSNGNSTESIFEFQFDGSTTQNNPFYGLCGNAPNAQLQVQQNVGVTVFPLDPNDSKNVDVRAAIATNPGISGIWKWIGTPGSSASVSATTSFRHWIVYRYADILLMEAEAYAWTNRGTDALNIVLQIKQRSNNIYVPGVSLDFPNDPTNALSVSNYILDERNREFIYEGKRWFDLVRHARRNYPNNVNILINALVAVLPPAYQQNAIAKLNDPNSFYLPIPNSDILQDPNLKQNPFYK